MPTATRSAVLRRAVSLALSAALAGCASLPPETPTRHAKAPSAYGSAEALAAPAAPWPSDRWWTRYADAQLDALMDEALANSPTLAQAAYRVARAQSATGVAVAAGLPQLSVNGSVQEMKQSYNLGIPPQFVPQGLNDYGRVTADLTWTLDFFGKTRAEVAAATSEAFAAAADAAEARRVLTTAIASDYAALVQLYAQRDVTAEAVKVREQTAALTAQRIDNGLDTQAELKQAQAAVPATRARLEALDGQIAQTRDALAALAGAGPDRGLALARPVAPAVAALGLPPEVGAVLIGRRPDVVAARWRAEAASKRVSAARAAFYPNINLVAYAGSQSLYVSMLTASGSAIAAVGPALSLPIFQGGRLRAELRGAKAGRDAAVAAYDEALTEALKEVADAVAAERALAPALADARAALEAGEGAYHVAQLRYAGGLSTFQAVLLAEDAVLAERQAVTDLESRAFADDVALIRALGGGYSDPAATPHGPASRPPEN